MTGQPEFREDLYKGTAPYYDRFRPPYPPAMLDDLRARVPLNGGGRLLDLACGTGQIAFPLASDFDEVWAVDQEEESVAFGQAKALETGVSNIMWQVGRAEEVQIEGSFELVTIGNAFQRLHRYTVAEHVASWLRPAGCVALLWGGIPWQGEATWQQALNDVFENWMARVGALDRVPAGWQEAIENDSHAQVLERAGLSYLGNFEFSVEIDWSVDSLTGFAYSTSFLNPIALGHHMEEFERDLQAKLRSCEPGGVFHQAASFSYDLARRSD